MYFGVLLSIAAYILGKWLQNKTGWTMLNPLLISAVLVIAFLYFTGTSYETYMSSSKLISYMLTPATICLAIPLYKMVEVLKQNRKALFWGILAGVLASLCSILLFAVLFKLDHESYVTILPKSITTAIGIGVSEELGGYVSITASVIVVTGILGNVFAEQFLKLIKVTEPVAKGIAIGSASHVIGTSRAMEMGKVEGAMSSLSIVISGLLTVVGASIFANFL